MKTSYDSRSTRSTETEKEPFDFFLFGIVALIVVPFILVILASLWVKSDAGLGWAIFLLGLIQIQKYHEQGKVSCLIGTVCSIALMAALWQQNLIATIIVGVITVATEVFQFTKTKTSEDH